jgi:hypothetical protein
MGKEWKKKTDIDGRSAMISLEGASETDERMKLERKYKKVAFYIGKCDKQKSTIPSRSEKDGSLVCQVKRLSEESLLLNRKSSEPEGDLYAKVNLSPLVEVEAQDGEDENDDDDDTHDGEIEKKCTFMSTMLAMFVMLTNARPGVEKPCNILGTEKTKSPYSPQPDEPGQSFYVPVIINGILFAFLYDTGANQTFMDEDSANRTQTQTPNPVVFFVSVYPMDC